MSTWSIGQIVRVRLPNSSSCQAIITTLNLQQTPTDTHTHTSTVDVLYENGLEWANGVEEESHVPLDRLSALLRFEDTHTNTYTHIHAQNEDAQFLRERGNELFASLRDYGAALVWYEKALNVLAPRAVEGLRIGATLLITPSPQDIATAISSASTKQKKKLLRVRLATLADVNKDAATVDVIYDGDESSQQQRTEDDEEEENDEEDGVALTRTCPLPSPLTRESSIALSKTLLNTGRCYLKSHAGRLPEALSALSLVVFLLGKELREKAEEGETDSKDTHQTQAQEEIIRLLVSAYEIRCRSLIRGGEFSLAKLDARRLLQLGQTKGRPSPHRQLSAAAEEGVMKAKVKALVEEMEREAKRRGAADKRLVKSMCGWVGEVMENTSSNGVGGGAGAARGGEGQAQTAEEAAAGCAVA